jgi:hypothetical protein
MSVRYHFITGFFQGGSKVRWVGMQTALAFIIARRLR